jgi:hypothetical protein
MYDHVKKCLPLVEQPLVDALETGLAKELPKIEPNPYHGLA